MKEEMIEKKPTKRKNLILCGEGLNCCLFDSRRGSIYALNEAALSIIKLCDGKNTIRDIIGSLVQVYDMEEKVIIDDTLKFINDLILEGIVRC